jgi:hypothetical protein
MKILPRGVFNILQKILMVLLAVFFTSCSSTTSQIKSINSENIVNVAIGHFVVPNDFKRVDEIENSFEFISADERSLNLFIAETDFGDMHSTTDQLGESWQSGMMIYGIPSSQVGNLPGTGYIQDVKTGSGYAITPSGYYYVDRQKFDEAHPFLISGNPSPENTAELYAALSLHTVEQKDPVYCLEEGIEWLRDIGFVYCITQLSSELTVTYTYGASSIIYTEKTDDLKSFKQNCELSKLVDFVYDK